MFSRSSPSITRIDWAGLKWNCQRERQRDNLYIFKKKPLLAFQHKNTLFQRQWTKNYNRTKESRHDSNNPAHRMVLCCGWQLKKRTFLYILYDIYSEKLTFQIWLSKPPPLKILFSKWKIIIVEMISLNDLTALSLKMVNLCVCGGCLDFCPSICTNSKI